MPERGRIHRRDARLGRLVILVALGYLVVAAAEPAVQLLAVLAAAALVAS